MNGNTTIDERIVILGAGNMATRLAIAFENAGCQILQIYSRTLASAAALKARLHHDTAITDNTGEVRGDGTLYLFSLSDNALPDVVQAVSGNNALWIHTAGSMPLNVFAGKTPHYGVMYPMQTVHKDRAADWKEVPIFTEAAQEDDLQRIEALARRLSGRVIRSNSEQRQALHLAAVFACNFANHMYAIAEGLLKEQGLTFDVMKLLIRETEKNAEQMSPRMAQTGPAIRHDVNVMAKHLAQLKDSPESELYKLISRNIEKYGTAQQEKKPNTDLQYEPH